MYNITCKNCGFANPLKTEYLTFCEQCGKKLSTNFQEWSKLNPGKNFDDFKKEIGSLSLPTSHPVAGKRFSLKSIILTAVLVLFSGISWWYFSNGNDLKGLFLPANTPPTLLTGKWERSNYGNYGFSLEAPEQLEKTDVDIPVAFRQRLDAAESFYYHPSKGLKVQLTALLFEEGITVNFEGAASAAINELNNQPGVTNLEFKLSPLMNTNIRGLLLDGSFHENGIFMRFQCAVFAQQSNLWSIWVIYRDADQNGQKVAQRIMDSVEINPNLKSI